jgi:predicted DNA binding CopG/RHH family protein
MEEMQMRTEYDFSKARKNPYIKKLRKQITIRLDADTIEYFKRQAEETGIKYQNLINLYLSDCVMNKKTIKIAWK